MPLASTSPYPPAALLAALSSAAAVSTTHSAALVSSPLPTPASSATSRARTLLLLLLPAPSPLPTSVTVRSKLSVWLDRLSTFASWCPILATHFRYESMKYHSCVNHDLPQVRTIDSTTVVKLESLQGR